MSKVTAAGTRWDIVEAVRLTNPDEGCAQCSRSLRPRTFCWWEKTEDILLCEACHEGKPAGEYKRVMTDN